MKEVSEIFNKDINFGDIHYEVEPNKSDIDTGKTSEDNVRLLLDWDL